MRAGAELWAPCRLVPRVPITALSVHPANVYRVHPLYQAWLWPWEVETESDKVPAAGAHV